MSATIFNLLLAVFLLAANGFFVAAEFALVKSKGFRIDSLVEEGRVGARLTQDMLKNVEAYLACCQLGISFLVGFLLFSSLHIVFGEQVPKTLAIREPEPVALWIAYPLHAAFLLFFLLSPSVGVENDKHSTINERDTIKFGM